MPFVFSFYLFFIFIFSLEEKNPQTDGHINNGSGGSLSLSLSLSLNENLLAGDCLKEAEGKNRQQKNQSFESLTVETPSHFTTPTGLMNDHRLLIE